MAETETCDLCGRPIEGDAVTTCLGTFCDVCDEADRREFEDEDDDDWLYDDEPE